MPTTVSAITWPKTPEAVYDFLNQVMEPALIAATRDRDDMQAIINREGGTFKLAPWTGGTMPKS